VRGALWSSVKGQRLRRERNVTWVPWPIVAPIVAQTALQPEVAATSLPWLVTQCLAGWYRAPHNATEQRHYQQHRRQTSGSTAVVTFIVLRDVICRINAEEPYVRDPVTCRLFEACAFPHTCRREEINRAGRDSPRVARKHGRELPLATRNTTPWKCLVFVIDLYDNERSKPWIL